MQQPNRSFGSQIPPSLMMMLVLPAPAGAGAPGGGVIARGYSPSCCGWRERGRRTRRRRLARPSMQASDGVVPKQCVIDIIDEGAEERCSPPALSKARRSPRHQSPARRSRECGEGTYLDAVSGHGQLLVLWLVLDHSTIQGPCHTDPVLRFRTIAGSPPRAGRDPETSPVTSLGACRDARPGLPSLSARPLKVVTWWLHGWRGRRSDSTLRPGRDVAAGGRGGHPLTASPEGSRAPGGRRARRHPARRGHRRSRGARTALPASPPCLPFAATSTSTRPTCRTCSRSIWSHRRGPAAAAADAAGSHRRPWPRAARGGRHVARAQGAQAVVCGHSHVPFLGRDRGLTVFNPDRSGHVGFICLSSSARST